MKGHMKGKNNKNKAGKTETGHREQLWICGVNPVREALRSPAMQIEEILLARNDAPGREIIDLADPRSIPVSMRAGDELEKATGHSHHQGVAARMDQYPYVSLESLLDLPPLDREPLVVLDSIQDPQNLGALVRSACFLGAKGVVIPKDRSAGVTSTVIKVAAGGASYIPIAQTVNLARALDRMKESGLWIVGLAADAPRTLYEEDLGVPLAMIVGNEHAGIRPLLLKKCDFLVSIPRKGPLESLNAAAAGTIALAEIQRQRITRSSGA